MLADTRPGKGTVEETVERFLAIRVDGLVIAVEPGESMASGLAVPTVAGWRPSRA